MIYNNITLEVLIKDRPITEFPHNGKTYVEGRGNSKFSLRLFNHNTFRVEAIVSVDGLSIIDGKTAGPQSSGWLLAAGEEVKIPGWKLDDKTVAAFEFASRTQSYAAQSGVGVQNTGVIGILTYREKEKYVAQYTNPHYGTFGSLTGAPIFGMTATTLNINHMAPSASLRTSATSKGICSAVGTNTATSSDASTYNLGTGFGASTTFNSEIVQFARGDLWAMFMMYYDDLNGLKKRGVVIPPRNIYREPQAFPGMGCQPPQGWRG